MSRNLTMVRGDDRTFDFSDVTDPDGTAFNLAGATLRFIVDGLFTLTRGDGITVDESSGDILVVIDSEDTEDVGDRRTYRYELEVTTAAGEVHTPRRGTLTLIPDLEAVE